MSSIITALLTDANIRSASGVEKTLMEKAEIAIPWGGHVAE